MEDKKLFEKLIVGKFSKKAYYETNAILNPTLLLNKSQFEEWNEDDRFFSKDDALDLTDMSVELPDILNKHLESDMRLSDIIFNHYKYILITNNDEVAFVTTNAEVSFTGININEAYRIAKEIYFENPNFFSIDCPIEDEE